MNDPRSQAQGLAQLGRYGDSMLMHVNPEEVQGLQSLAQANGTSLTTNPYTGQPESFNIGSVIKTALPIAAGYMVGGPMGGSMMGSLAAGAATGAGIAAMSGENVLMGGLMGGLGGYGGYGIGSAAGNVAAQNASAAARAGVGPAANANLAGAMSDQAIKSQIMSPLSGMQPIGAQSGSVAGLASNVPQAASISSPGHQVISGKEFLTTGGGSAGSSEAMTNRYLANLKSPTETLTSDFGGVAREMGGGNAMRGYGKMAMTGAMPLLSGVELPTYGASEGEFEPPYDPNSQLDLSMDTGLRLVSNGGLISLANGGDVGLGEGDGDFIAGNFAAGDFAEGDNFGQFAEVTEAGQFNDFNQFNDFANDPLLQEPGFNDPLLQEPGGFNPAVNQPLPPEQNNFNAAVNQPLPPEQNNFNNPPPAGRFIEGSGDGLSDSIPASIEGQQEARLSDGEFVVPADVVSGIGNGSSDAGSAQLFNMMKNIRKRRTGMTTQPKEIRPTDMSI